LFPLLLVLVLLLLLLLVIISAIFSIALSGSLKLPAYSYFLIAIMGEGTLIAFSTITILKKESTLLEVLFIIV
jgi:hypothetical protein